MGVDMTPESFPSKITGSFTPDMKEYYFFRGSKYCRRVLTLTEKQKDYKKVVESKQVFKVGKDGTQMVEESGVCLLLLWEGFRELELNFDFFNYFIFKGQNRFLQIQWSTD